MNRNLQMILALVLTSSPCLAQGSKPASKTTAPAAAQTPAKADGSGGGDGYTATSSTHIDFSETSIDGKMKAPDGFFLQGRQANSLSQMVKLRSNFRSELRNSRSAIKTIVK